MSQWSACWQRYSLMAVSCRQFRWHEIGTHVILIARISEEARSRGHSPLVATVYDSLLRQAVCARARNGDCTLDISEAFSRIDETVLDAAKQRLQSTSRRALVAPDAGLVDPAAAGLQARAMAAGKALARQQQAQDRRESAMARPPQGGGGKAAGKGQRGGRPRSRSPKEGSRRDRRQNWYVTNVRGRDDRRDDRRR